MLSVGVTGPVVWLLSGVESHVQMLCGTTKPEDFSGV
jgi:hypothetical protein